MRPLRRIRRSLEAVKDAAVMQPAFVRSGHFYSPIASTADINRALNWDDDLPGVNLQPDRQIELFKQLVPLFNDVADVRYTPNNEFYGLADAAIYQAFLRHAKPKKVIEIGSGFSTAKLLDTADTFLPELQVLCVEPYPVRLLQLLRSNDTIEILRQPVQDVPLSIFTALEAGDVLFIDSTHVAKAGSDVVWLFLRILPLLSRGVYVHIHDVHWPFEYPEDWLREGRNWNEAYMLNAFLCHNSEWEIELFSSWMWHKHRELLPAPYDRDLPGSIWLKRT